ncbi:MAG: glycosyltransferase family 4 protein [Ruminococcaceae bacterium]|nr:glycosyltransferase family 4 protein [Oscillospiraceae bacterium]
MKEKLHVLVIPTWFPSKRDKITGTYHQTFCRALVKSEKADVNMIYVDPQGISDIYKYPFIKKKYTNEYEGYTLYAKRMLDYSKFAYGAYIRSYTKKLDKLFCAYVKKHGTPDVIHAQVLLGAGYAAAVIGKKYSIPVVITEHATYFESFFTGSKEKYARFACENAHVTCVGNYMNDILREKYGYESETLPNIVDTTIFSANEKQQSEDGTLRLTTVAALRPPKHIDDTVRALKILRDRGELGRFKFTVVGGGFMEEHYKRVTSELEMNDVVEFVGRKNAQEIAKYLSESDILVMASVIETFGIPAIEALAAGVPVVCTRCKGPEGFLDENCAEFCNTEDPEDLARAIKKMSERYGEMDTGYLQSRANEFSSESVADRAIGIYKKLIK